MVSTAEMSPAEAADVDEVAEFFVEEGLPLIAGRVIGWLLIRHWRGQPPFGGRRLRRVV